MRCRETARGGVRGAAAAVAVAAAVLLVPGLRTAPGPAPASGTAAARPVELDVPGSPPPPLAGPTRRSVGRAGVAAPDAVDDDSPPRWDWRELGGVTPARHQGSCDATWCFAAVGAIESLLLIEEGRAVDLAEQQVLACATPGRGCHGGWMDDAYRYVRNHGVGLESCFPYSGWESVACFEHDCTPAATIGGWVDVPPDEASLKAALRRGPVTTAMLVPGGFWSYDGSYCLGDALPTDRVMAVLLVGWDDDLCPGGAWIGKASLGPLWGNSGFFTVRRGLYGVGWHAQRPLYDAGQAPRTRVDLLYDGLGGDNDTWPEPGETLQLLLQVRNGWLAPARVDLRASVTLLGGPASAAPAEYAVGPLGAGALADLQPLFTLAVDRTAAPGDTVRLQVRYREGADPLAADTLAVAIGSPTVLLVDDDEGEDLQSWFADAIARTGHPFRVWEERRLGPPSAVELGRYRAVVWAEGVLGRLGADNYTVLADHLVRGGHLLLSGQDVGWWLHAQADAQGRAFYRDYLEAAFLADDSGWDEAAGVPGDPLGDGLAFTLGGEGGSGRQDYPSLIAPVGGAEPVFAYAPGLTAGLRSTTHGRLLYLAFGLEAIDQAAQRDSVMTRALRWLAGPVPDVSPPWIELLAPRGGEVFPAGSVQSVRWRAGDDRGVLLVLCELSRDGGATWPEIVGAAAPGDTALAWAVGDSGGTGLRIRVSARDRAGFWAEAASGDLAVAPAPGLPPLSLLGAVPNPATGATSLRFLPGRAAAAATVRIVDLRGRIVRTLAAGPLAAGVPASLAFDGRDDRGRPLPSGVYAWTVAVPGARRTGRLLLAH